jgi:hypothetical protein
MSKMSRTLLDSMGRFELEANAPEITRQEISARAKPKTKAAARQAAGSRA